MLTYCNSFTLQSETLQWNFLLPRLYFNELKELNITDRIVVSKPISPPQSASTITMQRLLPEEQKEIKDVK